MKKKTNSITNVILVVLLLAGLSLLLYPSVSNYWNSLHQSRAITDYAEKVAELDTEQYEAVWEAAFAYNAELAKNGGNVLGMSEEKRAEYESLLDVSGNGIMGYIEIPQISCSLPIYHGADDAVLQVAVGHLEWSSLPVGGESTHCVLSGHRGLPSAKLFTRLDELQNGDVFMLRVLDEVLTYEVDQVLIVEPDEINSLGITQGEDYCTLVTCTPYGINTHRLLVRGHRIENIAESDTIWITADAGQIEPLIVAPFAAIPLLLVLLVLLFVPKRRPRGEMVNEKN